MPLTLIVFFHSYLKKQNALVDSYIKKAIDDHPETCGGDKSKNKKNKKTLFQDFTVRKTKKAAEKLLEEQIKQI